MTSVCFTKLLHEGVATIEQVLGAINNNLCASLPRHHPEVIEVRVHCADKPATLARCSNSPIVSTRFQCGLETPAQCTQNIR